MHSNDSPDMRDAPEGAPPPAAGPALEEQLRGARDEQIRLLAEMENQRKRLARDVESARKYAAERVLADLLPVADSLEAGLAADPSDAAKLHEGMELTLRMLTKAMDSNGLKAVDPTGQPFNPELHQAMTMVETGEHAPGTVVTVFQKGYRLNDRVLRPALVAVAKEPSPPKDA
ncbi:MAG TPA: nucleotide exchange factor GrpE [Xanthomonadales bacterium]|nr:nucleotide exchange factor GrpE [Xanthomonadales bacterium]